MENLTEEQIAEKLQSLAGWSLAGNALERTFVFKNFLRAMWFVNAVGYIAEAMNHHPDIAIHYNEVTLRIWTHVTGGITERDFRLAHSIDAMQAQ
jgi:4a-hydroxytetrahydrobiopterin dehydratase